MTPSWPAPTGSTEVDLRPFPGTCGFLADSINGPTEDRLTFRFDLRTLKV